MVEIKKNAKEINYKILSAKNTLIVAHKNPDSDSLGSVCAISKYLDSLNKKYFLFSLDKPSTDFNFLSNVFKIKTEINDLKPAEFDLIIVLDSGDLNHVGIKEFISDSHFVINIDHHPTNTEFGNINLVISEAVSTTEIIYNFFKNINYFLDKEIATCLLAGIIGDTNNFTNQNTTYSSFKAAANLMSAGAKLTLINNSLAIKKDASSLNLWGKILSRLAKNKAYNTVSAIIKKDDLNNISEGSKAIEGLTNFLNNLSGVKIAFILREIEKNKIKVSLRSNDESIDLTQFVKIFDGGGHKKAAGFTISGKIIETKNGWQIT